MIKEMCIAIDTRLKDNSQPPPHTDTILTMKIDYIDGWVTRANAVARLRPAKEMLSQDAKVLPIDDCILEQGYEQAPATQRIWPPPTLTSVEG